MSTSKSDCQSDDEYIYRGRANSSCVLLDEESDVSEDLSDSVSKESYSNDEVCFVSFFDAENNSDTSFLCDYQTILEYRRSYEKSNKTPEVINSLWGGIIAHVPWLGDVYLKLFDPCFIRDNKAVITNKSKKAIQNNKSQRGNKIVNNNKKKEKRSVIEELALFFDFLINVADESTKTKTCRTKVKTNGKAVITNQTKIDDKNNKKSSNDSNKLSNGTEKPLNGNKQKSSVKTSGLSKDNNLDSKTKQSVAETSEKALNCKVETKVGQSVIKQQKTEEAQTPNTIETNSKEGSRKSKKKKKSQISVVENEEKIVATQDKSIAINIKLEDKSTATDSNKDKLVVTDTNSKDNLKKTDSTEQSVIVSAFKDEPTVSDTPKNTSTNTNKNKNKLSTGKAKDSDFVEPLSNKQLKKIRHKEKKQVKEECKKARLTASKEKLKETKESIEENDKIADPQDSNEKMLKNMTNAMYANEDVDPTLMDDINTIPTFYTEVFKRKEKLLKKNTEEKNTPSSTPPPVLAEAFASSESENEEFVLKSKKRSKNTIVSKVNNEESDKLGDKALESILLCDWNKAIKQLTKAMALNSTDHRHYLNRSYCYLKVEKPSNALADSQTVIQNSKNLGFLFIANLRAGQASFYMKKYLNAETFLKAALHIWSGSPHAERLLFQVQIARIMEDGNSERNAMHALDLYPDTADAIKYLRDTYIPRGDDDDDPDILCYSPEYDNLVYESDGESKAETLNKLMKNNPEEMRLNHVAQPLLTWLRPSTGFEKPKSFPVNKTMVNGKNMQVTENAVWIGSLTDQITESMLKKAFRQYGSVISVHRPDGKAFGFVNFEKREDAAKLLNTTTTVRINGIDCKLRAAVRKE